MIYALNVFNLVPEKEDEYRRYAELAGRLLLELGGKVVVAGRDPLRMIEGDVLREWFLIVSFPDELAFSKFLSSLDSGPTSHIRSRTTRDYLWTIYEPWELDQWVQE